MIFDSPFGCLAYFPPHYEKCMLMAMLKMENNLQIMFYCQKTNSGCYCVQIGLFGTYNVLNARRATKVALEVPAITRQTIVLERK